MAHDQAHQQHPLSTYLWIWGLLFVLSVMSYMVDYVGLEGLLKFSLITLFMLLKAGLIMAVFMHMIWERMALVMVVIVPTGALAFLMALMILESNYTLLSRLIFALN